jgi:excisionase family DNA binding protein
LPVQYITIKDAAAKVGVHPRTVRRWIEDGLIDAYRVGPRVVRIDAASLDSLAVRMGGRP